MAHTLGTIFKKIERLEQIILGLRDETQLEFRPIDYREYIQVDLNEFERVWKYKGLYYKVKSKLYARMRKENTYTLGREGFYNLLADADRQKELWEYEIQLIYCKLLETNRHITSDGQVLTASKYTLIRGNQRSTYTWATQEGELFRFSRAHTAYSIFVDPFMEDDAEFIYMDGFEGNCGIDNIAPKCG